MQLGVYMGVGGFTPEGGVPSAGAVDVGVGVSSDMGRAAELPGPTDMGIIPEQPKVAADETSEGPDNKVAEDPVTDMGVDDTDMGVSVDGKAGRDGNGTGDAGLDVSVRTDVDPYAGAEPYVTEEEVGQPEQLAAAGKSNEQVAAGETGEATETAEQATKRLGGEALDATFNDPRVKEAMAGDDTIKKKEVWDRVYAEQTAKGLLKFVGENPAVADKIAQGGNQEMAMAIEFAKLAKGEVAEVAADGAADEGSDQEKGGEGEEEREAEKQAAETEEAEGEEVVKQIEKVDAEAIIQMILERFPRDAMDKLANMSERDYQRLLEAAQVMLDRAKGEQKEPAKKGDTIAQLLLMLLMVAVSTVQGAAKAASE